MPREAVKNCETNGCGKGPVYGVTWGTDERQTAILCHECKHVLWERVKPQIAAGVCFWIEEFTCRLADSQHELQESP